MDFLADLRAAGKFSAACRRRDWSQRFPHSERILAVEGGAVYAARGEDAFWVITDEGTLAGILPEEDLGALIKLERFDDEAAWFARIQQFRPSR